MSPTLEVIQQKSLPLLKKHGVTKAALFGSVVRGEAKAGSDIDFLVDFMPGKSLLDLIALKHDLEDTLGKEVDLVEYGAVKPLLRKYVMQDHTPIL